MNVLHTDENDEGVTSKKSFLYDMCYLPTCENENFYLKEETGL